MYIILYLYIFRKNIVIAINMLHTPPHIHIAANKSWHDNTVFNLFNVHAHIHTGV